MFLNGKDLDFGAVAPGDVILSLRCRLGEYLPGSYFGVMNGADMPAFCGIHPDCFGFWQTCLTLKRQPNDVWSGSDYAGINTTELP